MKKLISVSILILFFTSNSISQENPEDLKGEVASIKKKYIQPFKKNNKWLDGEIQAEFEFFFDRDKRIIKEIEKNDKNIVLQKNYIYKNASQAKEFCQELIKRKYKSSSFSESDENPIEKFCKQNIEKDLTMKIQYNIAPTDRAPKPFKTFIYKTTKNKIEEVVFDSENFMEYQTVSKLDNKGNLKEKIKYDPDFNQIEKEIYNYSTSPLTKTVKYFNSNDILVKEVKEEYRLDNTIRKRTETIYDNMEMVFSKIETDFDTSGIKIKERVYSHDNTLENESVYEYTFDKNGNWIREIKYEKIMIYNKLIDSEKPPKVTVREIKYYPSQKNDPSD